MGISASPSASAIAETPCSAPAAAARTFLAREYKFAGPQERIFGLSSDGLRKVEWQDLGRFFPDVEFFYVFRSFDRKLFSLLAVADDCSVSEIDGFKSLERFVKQRGVGAQGSEEQQVFARLLVKMGNVSGVYGGGYADGVGTIHSADDIQFRSHDEKRALEKAALIKPPRIESHDGGFDYHFFSWESRTTMEVLENVLEVDQQNRVRFSWKVVGHDIGMPQE
jgi:hypothetical protein